MYLCPVCAAALPYKQTFEDHLDSHNERTYFCDDCGKSYNTARSLYFHAQKYHPKTRFTCEQCEKIFQNKIYLQRHISSDHEGNKYICDYCPKVFHRKDYLKTHQMTCSKDHSQIEVKICPKEYCKKEFLHKKNLKSHMRTHSDEENDSLVYCDKCRKSFAQKYRLQLHMNTTHNVEDVGKLTCKFCKIKLSKPSNFRRHMKSKHNSNDRNIACFGNNVLYTDDMDIEEVAPSKHGFLSSKEFDVEAVLKVHEVIIRKPLDAAERAESPTIMQNDSYDIANDYNSDNDIEIYLEDAIKVFNKNGNKNEEAVMKSTANENEESMTNITEDQTKAKQNFSCYQCLATFSSSYNLKRHEERFHNEILIEKNAEDFEPKEIVFSCDQCGVGFVRSNNLRRHKLSKHFADLVESSELISDEEKSTKEYKFCWACDKKFSNNSSLRRHQKRYKHEEEIIVPKKTNICDQCNQEFSTTYNLSKHQRKFGHSTYQGSLESKIRGLLKNKKGKSTDSKSTVARKVKLLQSINKNISGGNESITEGAAKTFMKENLKTTTKVLQCSKVIQDFLFEMSAEDGHDLLTNLDIPGNKQEKLITGLNNIGKKNAEKGKITPNIFPSRRKMKEIRLTNTAHINKDEFFIGYKKLLKSKQGKKKDQFSLVPVVTMKHFRKNLIERCKENLEGYKFNDKPGKKEPLKIGITQDRGNSRCISEFAPLNNIDSKIVTIEPHIFNMMRASDAKENMIY